MGTLRILAVTGAVLSVGWGVWEDGAPHPRQVWVWLVGAAVACAAWILAGLFLADERAALLDDPEPLVPLGIAVGATTWLSFLAGLPFLAPLARPSSAWTLGAISLSVSATILLQMALWVACACWTTTLLLDRAHGEPSDASGTADSMLTAFLRVLVAETVGWGALFAVAAVVLTLPRDVLWLSVLALVPVSVLWNLATASWVVRAVDTGRPLGLLDEVRLARGRAARWRGPVIAQLALLGVATLLYVSWSDAGRTVSRTNWAANAIWVGGYEASSRWTGAFADAFECDVPAALTAGLTLVLGTFAIAVKMRVAAVAADVSDVPDDEDAADD